MELGALKKTTCILVLQTQIKHNILLILSIFSVSAVLMKERNYIILCNEIFGIVNRTVEKIKADGAVL